MQRRFAAKAGLIAAALIAVLMAEGPAEAGQWAVTGLPYLPGAGMSSASDINNAGQIAGTSLGLPERPFLWQPGGFVDIANVPGGPHQGFGYGVNQAGHVVGMAYLGAYSDRPDERQRAVLWRDGVLVDLGLAPGAKSSAGYAVNDVGQVVGITGLNNYLGYRVQHAAYWDQAHGMVDLGTLPGGDVSAAVAINNSGRIVGRSTVRELSSFTHAVLWLDGQAIDLGVSPGAIAGSEATDINEAGWIVGRDAERAVIWRDGLRTLLATLGQDADSRANGINDAGQIVGYSRLSGSGDGHAVLWQDGAVTDLNSFADVVASGWTLLSATDINDSGQIIGLGISPRGFYQGFLLSPVPEPQGAALAVLGMAIVAAAVRRRA